MNEHDIELFESQRRVLTALAYRMLGEQAAAEDVVQETWIRWRGTLRSQIQTPQAWLRRTAANLAIDALRSARARREIYVGPWLPEPLVGDAGNSPEDAFDLARDCELALLWAMERLAPEERAAFILRTAFDADYSEIAKLLGKSEATCRQIISRAKQRVRDGAPRFAAPEQEVADLLTRFSKATMAGDRETVIALLAPDVIAISDGGGKARAALRPLQGAEEVVDVLLAIAAKRLSSQDITAVSANGRPALAILTGGEDDLIYTIAPDDAGRVKWIYMMRNPEKLPN